MKKVYRVKNKKEIEALLKKKQSYGNKAYVLYVAKNIETDHFRIGVTASKKLGNAVVRNRIKRQMRAVVLPFKNNISKYDLFLIARPGFIEMSFNDRTNQLKSLLKKSGVLVMEEK